MNDQLYINGCFYYEHPLYQSLIKKEFERAAQLINEGLNLNHNIILDGNYNQPLLNRMVYEKNNEAVKFLLEHGANVNVKSEKNVSPLMVALKQKNSELIKLLIDHGANTRVIDQHGENLVLQWAYLSEDINIFKTIADSLSYLEFFTYSILKVNDINFEKQSRDYLFFNQEKLKGFFLFQQFMKSLEFEKAQIILNQVKNFRPSKMTDESFNYHENQLKILLASPIEIINNKEEHPYQTLKWLLSKTYIENPLDNKLIIEKLKNDVFLSCKQQLQEVLAIGALEIADKKLYIILDSMNDFNGAYNFHLNMIRVSFSEEVTLLGTIIHELGHHAMDKVFNNNHNPYKSEDVGSKAMYEDAIRKCLINVKEKMFNLLEINYLNELVINDISDQQLLFFPLKHELSYFPLKQKIEKFNFNSEFELEKDHFSTFQLGEKIRHFFRFNGDLNQENNWKTEFLILGKVPSLSNLFENDEKLVIANFLSIYNSLSSYDEESEHREFIVRYEQAIAGNREEAIKVLFKPLKDYIDEYVKPAMREYIENHPKRHLLISLSDREAAPSIIENSKINYVGETDTYQNDLQESWYF